MKNKLDIFFDFDGVICHDKFYEKSLIPHYQNLFLYIQENIFSQNELIDDWMRGKIKYQDINEKISNETGFDFEELNILLLGSVELMSLDENIMRLINKLGGKKYRLSIVTDNMDIFSEIIKRHKLSNIFEMIINSSDEGFLKKDGDGKLFDIALRKLGISDISNVLLIDDSKKNIDLFQEKGGKGFLYNNFDALIKYLS